MKRFKNILVGVDLSQGDRLVSNEIPPPTAEAIKRALWLAKLNSAHVTFFYSLDISCAAQRLVEEEFGDQQSVLDEARRLLSECVSQARAEGVEADQEMRFGKSWMEMIRRVLLHKHDLVLAGTRHMGATKNFLLGSTGIKLLRKCPCPVWITQPSPDQNINAILVAHDLRPVGDFAMVLGCSMAQLHRSRLHVLHSLEIPEFGIAHPHGSLEEWAVKRRSDAVRHIESQLVHYEFAQEPQVHIASESPDVAILHCIQEHQIELLTMGTIARAGIAGFFTGNTAEQLLPQIPCSVLAVKPSDFISPVTL